MYPYDQIVITHLDITHRMNVKFYKNLYYKDASKFFSFIRKITVHRIAAAACTYIRAMSAPRMVMWHYLSLLVYLLWTHQPPPAEWPMIMTAHGITRLGWLSHCFRWFTYLQVIIRLDFCACNLFRLRMDDISRVARLFAYTMDVRDCGLAIICRVSIWVWKNSEIILIDFKIRIAMIFFSMTYFVSRYNEAFNVRFLFYSRQLKNCLRINRPFQDFINYGQWWPCNGWKY